jgi:hypothetical protein
MQEYQANYKALIQRLASTKPGQSSRRGKVTRRMEARASILDELAKLVATATDDLNLACDTPNWNVF